MSIGGDTPRGRTAFGVAYNRFWFTGVSTRFGIWGAHKETGGGERDFIAYYASAEVHWWRDRRVSPYAGLGLAAARDRQDAEFGSDSRSTTAPLVSGGVDVTLTPRFALALEGRYLEYDEALLDEERFRTAVDSITVLLTGKVRF